MCPKPFSWAKNKRKLFSVGKTRGPLIARAALNSCMQRQRHEASARNEKNFFRCYLTAYFVMIVKQFTRRKLDSKRKKGIKEKIQFGKSKEYNRKFDLWLSIFEISFVVINLNSPHQSVLVTAALSVSKVPSKFVAFALVICEEIDPSTFKNITF